jgi:hypothetical protein
MPAAVIGARSHMKSDPELFADALIFASLDPSENLVQTATRCLARHLIDAPDHF